MEKINSLTTVTLWLLLLFLGECCYSLHFVRPVTVDVIQEQYVHVLVGMPGKQARLRLDLSLHDIYLFSTYRDGSSSYVISSQPSLEHEDCLFGSELLTFGGDTRLRLPVLYNCDPPGTTDGYREEVIIQGVLGLGSKSPLWKHWRKYTVSSWALYLGEHALYQSRYQGEKPPHFVPLGEGLPVQQLESGKNYSLVIRPNSPYSYLDLERKEMSSSRVLQFKERGSRNSVCLILHPKYDLRTLDAAHERRELLRSTYQLPENMDKGEEEKQMIVVGGWAWRHSLLFVDVLESSWSLLPAYTSFQAVDPPSCTLFLCSAVASVLFIFWIFCCYAHGTRTQNQALLMLMVKAALLLLSFSILLTHSWGYQGWRLLSAHLNRDGRLEYGILLSALFLALFLDSLLLFHWYAAARGSAAYIAQNRLLLDNIVLLSIWLCLLEYVPCSSSRNSLTVISYILASVNVLKLYECQSHHQGRHGLLLTFLSVLSGLFMLLWNVRPLMRADFRYSPLFLEVYLFSICLVFFTAFYVYYLTAVSGIKYRMDKLQQQHEGTRK